jgi:hypothetical protein
LETAEEQRKRACEAKIPYRTEAEAKAAASYAQWQRGGQAPAVYRCNICDKYHLTRYKD